MININFYQKKLLKKLSYLKKYFSQFLILVILNYFSIYTNI